MPVRGSTITFTATCLDAAGMPAFPTEATLHLVYAPADGGPARRKEAVPLVIAGPVVTGRWDSSVASVAMPIIWHIRVGAPGGEMVAADGVFTLTAMEANPASR